MTCADPVYCNLYHSKRRGGWHRGLWAEGFGHLMLLLVAQKGELHWRSSASSKVWRRQERVFWGEKGKAFLRVGVWGAGGRSCSYGSSSYGRSKSSFPGSQEQPLVAPVFSDLNHRHQRWCRSDLWTSAALPWGMGKVYLYPAIALKQPWSMCWIQCRLSQETFLSRLSWFKDFRHLM